MSQAYGDNRTDTHEERQQKIQILQLSLWALMDPRKPWVLVPGGSILGYFNWVRHGLLTSPDLCD